jgi:hypothetical protein
MFLDNNAGLARYHGGKRTFNGCLWSRVMFSLLAEGLRVPPAPAFCIKPE